MTRCRKASEDWMAGCAIPETAPTISSLLRPYRLSDPANPDLQVVEREVIGVVLDVFASYGLRGDDALPAVRGLCSVVHGFAALESAGGFGIPLEVDESFRRLLRRFVGGLRQDLTKK